MCRINIKDWKAYAIKTVTGVIERQGVIKANNCLDIIGSALGKDAEYGELYTKAIMEIRKELDLV